MTFREKLTKEHPECVGENFTGGCCCCPSSYKYETAPERCEAVSKEACAACWDREMEDDDE